MNFCKTLAVVLVVVCFVLLLGPAYADRSRGSSKGRSKRAGSVNRNEGEEYMQISRGVEAMISQEPIGPSLEGFDDTQTTDEDTSDVIDNDIQPAAPAKQSGGSVGLSDAGPKMTLAKGQRLQSAVITKHTFETRPVETNFEEQEPQLIEVEAPAPELEIRFKSTAGRIKVKSFHEPGEAPGEVEETSSDEEPQRLISTVRKPIISEVHEKITPFRRVVQMINPVEETVHTIVAEGKGQRMRAGGSSKTSSRKQSSGGGGSRKPSSRKQMSNVGADYANSVDTSDDGFGEIVSQEQSSSDDDGYASSSQEQSRSFSQPAPRKQSSRGGGGYSSSGGGSSGGFSKTSSRKQSSGGGGGGGGYSNNNRREQSSGRVGGSESYSGASKSRSRGGGGGGGRRPQPSRGPAARGRGNKGGSSSCSSENGCGSAPRPVAPVAHVSQKAEY